MTQKTKWLDLLINGDTRKAEAAKVNDLYVVMVPAANLVDASGSGQNTPAVQGHRAVFDKNGVLLGVDALGWNAEGGFYNTKWPSKADSVYNANAAKTYAPQVFLQMKKDGGWMNKFQNGGSTQPTQDLAMKELMAIVQQAATELQSNKPGQGVQTLAQIANDPQGSQLLDTLVQQVPEAGQIVEAVMKMIGSFKCGGKTKKKVKKGAKGCVPCKKLMRVGGKLVNVWSDCEGNIISKHQVGGYLIPKGLVGLTAQFVQEPYRKAKASTDAGNANDVHYYLNDDNKIYMQTYTADKGWETGLEADMNNFKNWVTTANTSGQILGKNFFVNGFNFDYKTNMGTMSKDDAEAAGIDVNQFKTSLGARGKYEASYNPLFGESKPSEVDITQGYINSLGGMNASVKHERQQRRKDRRAQRAEHRAYNSAAGLSTKDTDTSNDFNVLTTDEKLANLNNIDTNYANLASRMAAAMKAKWANYNVGTPASATTSSSRTDSKRDVLKQGGWLTKFLDGGTTEPKLSEYKFHRGEIKTPAGYGVIQEGFYPTYSFGNKTGITYDFDDSPRWGRNIYITPHGNDTVYYHTSDPYEYLDMYPTTYILVGTPYKSQQVAKKGWHNMLHGVNIPVRPLDGDEAAFNRAKKEK